VWSANNNDQHNNDSMPRMQWRIPRLLVLEHAWCLRPSRARPRGRMLLADNISSWRPLRQSAFMRLDRLSGINQWRLDQSGLHDYNVDELDLDIHHLDFNVDDFNVNFHDIHVHKYVDNFDNNIHDIDNDKHYDNLSPNHDHQHDNHGWWRMYWNL
jgi:hypothetical protein